MRSSICCAVVVLGGCCLKNFLPGKPFTITCAAAHSDGPDRIVALSALARLERLAELVSRVDCASTRDAQRDRIRSYFSCREQRHPLGRRSLGATDRTLSLANRGLCWGRSLKRSGSGSAANRRSSRQNFWENRLRLHLHLKKSAHAERVKTVLTLKQAHTSLYYPIRSIRILKQQVRFVTAPIEFSLSRCDVRVCFRQLGSIQ